MLLLHTILLLLSGDLALADPWYENIWADPLEKRKNVMDGNQVRTTIYNTGLTGRVGPEPSFNWPAGTNNEYVGDFCLMFGSAFFNPLLAHAVNSVAVTQSPARGRDEVNPANPSEYWTFMPLPGFAAPETSLVAVSTQPFSWPEQWPDSGADGWNSGLADNALTPAQEAYFWVDDSRDREFLSEEWAHRANVDHEVWLLHFPADPESALVSRILPFPDQPLLGGLGLKMGVRTTAWSREALQDVLFFSFDIHNTGSLELEASRLGLVVGTLIGGDVDSGDDINQVDPARNLLICRDGDDQGSAGWVPVQPGVHNVGLLGLVLLESPGDGWDWIDNDGDASPGLPRLDGESLAGMLAPHELNQGDVAVLIDYEDPAGGRPRRLVRVPAADQPITSRHRGQVLTCVAGQVVQEIPDNRIDDNFNGLIDEGPHQLGRAYIAWAELGLTPPDQGEIVPVPDALIQAHAPLLDERQDDGLDNDQDWTLADDLGADGHLGTGDEGDGDGMPTAGEPHFEQRDPDEADQLGLTGLDEFAFHEFNSRNDENLWTRMSPQVLDSTAGQPADRDVLISCGSFSLPAGTRTRLTVAAVFAVDLENLRQRVDETQRFYDSEFTELSTSVDPGSGGRRPDRISLGGPWPNPFNPATTVQVQLPQPGRIQLALYDCAGRLLRVLVDEVRSAGEHVIRVDGVGLASGLYFLRLEALGTQVTRKCLLMK